MKAGRRMRPGLVLAASVLISCGVQDVPERPVAALPWLQTDTNVYRLQHDGKGWGTKIGYSFVNAGTDTVYITNCNQHVVMNLQKLDAGVWRDFWQGETDGCLSGPLLVAPGEKYSGTLAVWGAEPGSTSHTTFKSADFSGRFRLLWHQPRLHYDARAANFGDTLPEQHRRSNEFSLDKGALAAGRDTVSPYSERIVIYMEASEAELKQARSEVSEDDFAAIYDDFMWYRAGAYEFLEQRRLPVITIKGRQPLEFMVDGGTRRYDFADATTWDVIVLYDAGREPRVIAPVDIDAATEYFQLPAEKPKQ